MFEIYDDKVYFVAETPDINKVIEIFLPKDDRGTIMDSHEIRVDLCRAVIHMEKKGVRVLKVRNIEDTNKASIDIWHMPEYQEAAESPVSDVVNTKTILSKRARILPNTNSATLISITRRKSMRWASISCF